MAPNRVADLATEVQWVRPETQGGDVADDDLLGCITIRSTWHLPTSPYGVTNSNLHTNFYPALCLQRATGYHKFETRCYR